MRHFEIFQWVDYARGLMPEQERLKMSTHLEEGCAECKALFSLFDAVSRTARSAGDIKVPPTVVKAAAAIFPAGSAAESGLLRRLAAKLVFDSFHAAQPLGARSSSTAAHLMFEAEDYSIDLREETEQNSSQCSLVGQIARRSAPMEPVARVPVFLLSGESVIARAMSNEFGEFCLEYVPKNRLRLAIPIVEQGVRIEIPLSKFTGRE